MDSTTTIIGLAILALFILPVVLISRSNKKKGSKFDKELISVGIANGIDISDKDVIGEYGAGLDTASNTLLFINWSGREKVVTFFSLKEVKAFDTVPSSNEMKKPTFDIKKAERLGFRFQFNNSQRPEFSIVFYTMGFGKLSESELNFFLKWSAIVRKGMSSVTPTVNKDVA